MLRTGSGNSAEPGHRQQVAARRAAGDRRIPDHEGRAAGRVGEQVGRRSRKLGAAARHVQDDRRTTGAAPRGVQRAQRQGVGPARGAGKRHPLDGGQRHRRGHQSGDVEHEAGRRRAAERRRPRQVHRIAGGGGLQRRRRRRRHRHVHVSEDLVRDVARATDAQRPDAHVEGPGGRRHGEDRRRPDGERAQGLPRCHAGLEDIPGRRRPDGRRVPPERDLGAVQRRHAKRRRRLHGGGCGHGDGDRHDVAGTAAGLGAIGELVDADEPDVGHVGDCAVAAERERAVRHVRGEDRDHGRRSVRIVVGEHARRRHGQRGAVSGGVGVGDGDRSARRRRW